MSNGIVPEYTALCGHKGIRRMLQCSYNFLPGGEAAMLDAACTVAERHGFAAVIDPRCCKGRAI